MIGLSYVLAAQTTKLKRLWEQLSKNYNIIVLYKIWEHQNK